MSQPRARFDPTDPPAIEPQIDGTTRWGPFTIAPREAPQGTGLYVPHARWIPPRGSDHPEYHPEDWPAGWARPHPLIALRALAGRAVASRLEDFPVSIPADPAVAPALAARLLIDRIAWRRLRAAGVAEGHVRLAAMLAKFLAGDWGVMGTLAGTPEPTEADRVLWPFASPAVRNRIALADGTGHVEAAYRFEATEIRFLLVLNPPRPGRLPEDGDGRAIALGAYMGDPTASEIWAA